MNQQAPCHFLGAFSFHPLEVSVWVYLHLQMETHFDLTSFLSRQPLRQGCIFLQDAPILLLLLILLSVLSSLRSTSSWFLLLLILISLHPLSLSHRLIFLILFCSARFSYILMAKSSSGNIYDHSYYFHYYYCCDSRGRT